MQNTSNLSAGNNQGLQLGVNNGTIGDLIFNNNTDDSCIKELRLTDPRYDKERIKDTKGGLLESSYKWILDHPDYRRWRDNNQSRLLWIKGDPGKGGTMLLMGIVDELERPPVVLKQAEQSISHATVLSYFFCQGTDSNLNSATAVLRGLIFLLAVQQPSLASHLHEKYKVSGPKLFEGANAFFALSEILSDMLQDRSLARTYIVIDALDECEIDRQLLLKFVVENTSVSRVKWIVSSRNWPEIDEQLGSAAGKAKLCLELNEKSISAAVSTYIRYRVDQLAQLKKYDSETESDVQNHLVSNANDTFLWVSLVCQELAKSAPWNTLSKLRKMSEAFPPGLDSLYQRMMEQINNSDSADICKRILAVVSVVYRPVTLEELPSLEKELESINPHYLSDIVESCGSLLTLRNGVIYFVHQSAKDYMSKKEITTIFPSGHTEAHRGILLQSLVAMGKLRRDIYGLHYPGFSIDDLKIPVPDPLASIRYSCVHWIDNLCDARHQDDLLDGGAVYKFLKDYLLYWIEAASWNRSTDDAVFAVAKLERLLVTVSGASSLFSLTLDAHRFLLSNGPGIKNAPLQTYASALLFSPTNSLTRELFKKQEPQWVSTRSIVGKHWSPLVRTLEGDYKGVRSVAFSHDGKFIASGSEDSEIDVWDVATGDRQQTLEGHNDVVWSVAFSPDRKSIASGSVDRTTRVWDIATGNIQHILEGHSNTVLSVAFSPDGRSIISGSYNGMIKVWDAITGAVQKTLESDGSSTMPMAISPIGEFIALGYHGTVEIWDTVTGKVQKTLEGHRRGVCSVAFSHDGKFIASGSLNGIIEVWDVATGKLQQTLKDNCHGVWSVALSPNGELIISASRDSTFKIWDVAAGVVQQALEDDSDELRLVAFSPDGKLIISAAETYTISIWDATMGEVRETHHHHDHEILSVAFSPDGDLIASSSDFGVVKVWHAATGKIKWDFQCPRDTVPSVAFLPSGMLIALESKYKIIRAWDVATGEVQQILKGHGDTVSFDPAGLYLTTNTGSIQIGAATHIDVQHLIQSQPQPQPREARQCGYGLSPDESWITWDGHRMLWLPPEYRPSASTIWRSAAPSTRVKVAICCRSRRVIVIDFSGPPPGLLSS